MEEAFERIFREADKDNDGKLSHEELRAMMLEDGYKLSDGELKASFRAFDEDEDGQISLEEYVSSMVTISGDIHNQASARKIFTMHDIDNSGTLDREEFEKVLFELEDELSEEETRRMREAFAKNEEEEVDYEEFLTIIVVD